MSETRVRAATLLSKVFLHYLVLLGDMNGGKQLLDLWLKIITIMDRLINSGQGDNLVNTVCSLYSINTSTNTHARKKPFLRT
jgi:brefeldin A-resistance guanine nucleotide exchange factor 1